MNRRNLPLIIGIALPLVFIAIISVVLFGPSLFINPQHDFLYTGETNYYGSQQYRNTYAVENGRISLFPQELGPNVKPEIQKDMPTLYLYDIESNSSHVIDYEDAKRLHLDPGPSSPDGYSIQYEYGHSGIFELFGSNSDNDGYFISRGSGKKKLNGLPGGRYSYGKDFKLIGWVK